MQVNIIEYFLLSVILSIASADCPSASTYNGGHKCAADDDTLPTNNIAFLTPTCVLSDSCYDLASYTTDNVGVTANVSVSCYNFTNHEVFAGMQPIEPRRSEIQVPQDIRGVTCTFGGCFSLFGFERRLNSGSCYIDKDECADNSSNNCDINANCTNDINGAFSCECTADYIGNGLECYSKVPPSLESDWTEREVALGDNLTISVAVTHGINPYLPLTNITWTHNGNTIENGVAVSCDLPSYEVPVTAMFHIESVSLDHMGLYTVTAVNLVGSGNFTFSIIIANDITTTLGETTGMTVITRVSKIKETVTAGIVGLLLFCSLTAILLTSIICMGCCIARGRERQKTISIHRGKFLDFGEENSVDKSMNVVVKWPVPASDGEDVWSIYESLGHVDNNSENKLLNVLTATRSESDPEGSLSPSSIKLLNVLTTTPSESDPEGSLSPNSINEGLPEFAIPLCLEGGEVKGDGGYIQEPTTTAAINLDQPQQAPISEDTSLYIFNEDSDEINPLPEMSLSELSGSENHVPLTSIDTEHEQSGYFSYNRHLDHNNKPALSIDQSYIQHPQF